MAFGAIPTDAATKRKRLEAFRAWINELCNANALDYTGLARRAGLAPSTLTRPMNSKNFEGPVTARTIEILATALKVQPPKELRSRWDAENLRAKSDLQRLSFQEYLSDLRGGQIEVTDTGELTAIREGLPVLSKRETGLGRLMFVRTTTDFVSRPPELSRSYDAFAIYCVGQRMAPAIKEGSLLAIDPSLPLRRNDYVVVRLMSDELKVREYLSESDNGAIVALYEDSFREEFIPLSDIGWVYRVPRALHLRACKCIRTWISVRSVISTERLTCPPLPPPQPSVLAAWHLRRCRWR